MDEGLHGLAVSGVVGCSDSTGIEGEASVVPSSFEDFVEGSLLGLSITDVGTPKKSRFPFAFACGLSCKNEF